MADISKIKTPDGTTYDVYDRLRYNKTVSRGEQLVVNGSGMMGDNTNWSSWTFDGSQSNSSPGSFTRSSTSYANVVTDELFPVDANLKYRFDIDLKSENNTGTMYAYLDFRDVDKYQITASMHMYYAGTLTTLARELKAGDTKVYLTDASAYETKGTGSHQRALIFWDYKNSFGYQYPPETYSRYFLMPAWTDDSSIDKVNNVITLTSAYTGVTHPAGTYVSQGNSGGTYKYSAITGSKVPTDWTHYTGYYDGVDYSGLNKYDYFAPGTAYCRVGFLWNYNSANDHFWLTNVSVKEVPQRAVLADTANTANNATSADQAYQSIRLAHSSAQTPSTIDNFRDAQIIFANASGFSDMGIAGSDGIVMWIPWSTAYGRQIMFDDTSHMIFSRFYSNGNWSAWKRSTDASLITGTLPVSNGGTGATTAATAADNIFNGLPTWTATPTDDTYFPRQDTGGSATYGKAKFSTVWSYISSKISSVLGLTATAYGGKAATAGDADTVSGHTVAKDVPSTAVFTDTSVTAVGNHYAPTGTTTKSASGASGTSGTTVQVVTGVTMDAKGHVTAVTSGAATDTTYESKTAASGGTAVSLVTTGEKYTWNNKTSNTGTVTQVTAGTGLAVGSTAGGNFTTSGTLNHTNSVTAQTTQAIYPIKIDAQGHISAYGSAVTPLTSSSSLNAAKLTGTVPSSCYTNTTYYEFEGASSRDTGTSGLVPAPAAGEQNYVLKGDGTWAELQESHYTGYLRAGASGGTANAATTSGNTYLNYVENGTNRSGVKLVPGTNMTITSDASGNVTFASSGGGTSYSAGTGLSISGTTINHSNSVTAGTAGTSSATSGTGTLAVPYVTYDAQGHVTGSGTHTHTITNNVTGSGTSGYLTQWSGTNTVSSSGIKIVTGRTSQFTCAKENTTTALASHSGFSSKPKVIGTFYNVSNTTNQLVLMITAQTETSTTFTIRNNGTAQRTGYVDWIAIGT